MHVLCMLLQPTCNSYVFLESLIDIGLLFWLQKRDQAQQKVQSCSSLHDCAGLVTENDICQAVIVLQLILHKACYVLQLQRQK